MSDLSLPSVELVTALCPVPMNGAPSSKDYNLFQTEVLSDLADLATCLNEAVLPVLNALPAQAAEGLDGAALTASRAVVSPLFRDAQGNLFTVADVLANLSADQASLALKIADAAARVQALQTRLATTSQNDLRASVQSLQDTVNSLSARLGDMLASVSSQGLLLAKRKVLVVDIPAQSAGSGTLDVTFAPAFADSSYAVTLALEAEGGLSLVGFTKKTGGSGLTAHFTADGSSPTGKLHILAQAL